MKKNFRKLMSVVLTTAIVLTTAFGSGTALAESQASLGTLEEIESNISVDEDNFEGDEDGFINDSDDDDSCEEEPKEAGAEENSGSDADENPDLNTDAGTDADMDADMDDVSLADGAEEELEIAALMFLMDDGGPDLAGLGTEESPYEVGSKEDMEELRQWFEDDWDYETYIYVKLTDNINLTAGKWGQFYFYGHFDGNGKTVLLNEVSLGGFFYDVGLDEGGTTVVKNLDLHYSSNVTYSDGDEDVSSVGPLANYMTDTVVRDCSVVVEGSVSSQLNAGGLVGFAEGSCQFFDVEVSIKGNVSGRNRVGGLAGSLDGNAVVKNPQITVDGVVSGTSEVGGLIGSVWGSLQAEDCEIEVHVLADDDVSISKIGGLIGSANLEDGSLILNKIGATGSLVIDAVDISTVGGLIGSVDVGEESLLIKESSAALDMKFTGKVLEQFGGAVGVIRCSDVSDETHESFAFESVIADSSQMEMKIEESLYSFGGLIGEIWGSRNGRIEDATVLWELEFYGEVADNVGGLIALTDYNNLIITGSAVEGNLSLDPEEEADTVGGYIGRLTGQAVMKDNRYTGNLSAKGSMLGGFIGEMEASLIHIDNCVVDGAVSLQGHGIGGFGGWLDTGFSDPGVPSAYIQETWGAIAPEEVALIRGSSVKRVILEPLPDEGTKMFEGAGGFVAYLSGDDELPRGFVLDRCHVDQVSVSMKADPGDDVEINELGGFIGTAENAVVIDSCYADVSISLQGERLDDVCIETIGGFIGIDETEGNGGISSSHVNLTLNIQLESKETVDVASIGGFAGEIGEGAAYADNYVNGNIRIEISGKEGVYLYSVGGFFGMTYEPGAIDGCFYLGELDISLHSQGDIDAEEMAVGGFIGRSYEKVQVENSYASGAVNINISSEEVEGGANIGGFIGVVSDGGSINNCYSSSDVSVSIQGGQIEETTKIGGFIGGFECADPEETDIINCYYTGTLAVADGFPAKAEAFGPILCSEVTVYENCYYDSALAGAVQLGRAVDSDPDGVTGLSTLEMVRENALLSMNGFDFQSTDSTWVTMENSDASETSDACGYYPQLRMFAVSENEDIAAHSAASARTSAYYHVELNGNGGSLGEETQIKGWNLYNTALDASGFMRGDEPALFWSTEPNGRGISYPLHITVSKDLKLYAIYDQPVVYTVTYDANGGKGDVPVDDAVYDEEDNTVTVKGPGNLSKGGYSFNGWLNSYDSKVYKAGDQFTITGNVTLTAQWKSKGGGGGPSPGKEEPEIEYGPLELDRGDHYAYIAGYPDPLGGAGAAVRPEANISREEAASIFFRLLTSESRAGLWAMTNDFTDVSGSRWSNNAISTMAKGGVISGDPDGSFRPEDKITRAEMASIIARFEKGASAAAGDKTISFNDTDGHWAESHIQLAASLGYVSGFKNGSFRPDSYMTRAEMASMLNRVLERQVESTEDLLEGMVEWIDNQNTEAWYYLDVQEASNSTHYERKEDGIHKKWIELRTVPDWSLLNGPNASPNMITQ